MAKDIPLEGQRRAEFVFSDHVGRKLADIRAGQGRRQASPVRCPRSKARKARSASRPVRISAGNCQGGKQGSQHGRQIRSPPSLLHADARRRRQRSVRRIGDDARGDERQAVPPGDSGGDVRFHVDGDRAGRRDAVGLLRRRRRMVSPPSNTPRSAPGRRETGDRSSRDRSACAAPRGRRSPPPSRPGAMPAPARPRCRC